MLRNIIAVVVGYIVMTITVVLLVMTLALAFPAYREAAENNTTPPTLPVVLNLVGSVFCAALGGCTCYWIAKRNANPVFAFAGIVLVLGVVYAVIQQGGPQPIWYLIALPMLGAGGILLGIPLGARLRKR